MWQAGEIETTSEPAYLTSQVSQTLCVDICQRMTSQFCTLATQYDESPVRHHSLSSPASSFLTTAHLHPYILTLAVFVVLQVPTALATNYGMLMAFYFLTGFFGSPILATGSATVADLYTPKKRAYGMTLWGVFAASAPSRGPLRSFSAHNLGAHVALFCNSHLVILHLPRDLRVQRPLPTCLPSPQGYRKLLDHVHFRDRFNDNVSS